ncbi:MAG: hypothetical protein V2J55_09615 [Candidatus Competibacteraceae bacterium]|nr:hypothetical protein [Candidatus Competibacteraceae bacterium]
MPPTGKYYQVYMLVRESTPAGRSRARFSSFADHRASRHRSHTADVAATSVVVE